MVVPAPPWPPRPLCTHTGRSPASFGSLFCAPLGEVADVAGLIETAYAYMCGLARHPALTASGLRDGAADGDGEGCDGGTSVCDQCGGRWPAAAFGAAAHPARARCVAFLVPRQADAPSG